MLQLCCSLIQKERFARFPFSMTKLKEKSVYLSSLWTHTKQINRNPPFKDVTASPPFTFAFNRTLNVWQNADSPLFTVSPVPKRTNTGMKYIFSSTRVPSSSPKLELFDRLVPCRARDKHVCPRPLLASALHDAFKRCSYITKAGSSLIDCAVIREDCLLFPGSRTVNRTILCSSRDGQTKSENWSLSV